MAPRSRNVQLYSLKYPCNKLVLEYAAPQILCLRLRTSLIYINNIQRDATQSSLFIILQGHYMFRVSTTHNIRSTQNCNYSLRYWSYFLCSYLPPTWPSLATLERGSCKYRKLQLQFCVLLKVGVADTQNMQSELAE